MSTFVLENVGSGAGRKTMGILLQARRIALNQKYESQRPIWLLWCCWKNLPSREQSHIPVFHLGKSENHLSSSWCRRSGDMWWFPGGHLHFNDSEVCFIFMSFLLQKKPLPFTTHAWHTFFFTMSCKADEAVDVGRTAQSLKWAPLLKEEFFGWEASSSKASRKTHPPYNVTGRKLPFCRGRFGAVGFR